MQSMIRHGEQKARTKKRKLGNLEQSQWAAIHLYNPFRKTMIYPYSKALENPILKKAGSWNAKGANLDCFDQDMYDTMEFRQWSGTSGTSN